MALIRCKNTRCILKRINLDLLGYKQIKLAPAYEVGAIRVVVSCPSCSTENLIWVWPASIKPTELLRDANEKDD
jgi:hypothetical protein